MAGEVQVAATWLFTKLVGDAGLVALVGGVSSPRIYLDLIPDGAALPAVVYNLQAGNDYQIPGPTRIWSDQVWQIKGVSEGRSLAPLTAVVDRLEVVLQAASGTAAGGRVHACVRETTISYTEADQGNTFRHLGSLWRLYVAAAPAA